jgi:hypothetical protein
VGIDDQIRSIEYRLTSLEKERTDLLSELENLRSQRDEHKLSPLLGRPTLMKAPESNSDFYSLFCGFWQYSARADKLRLEQGFFEFGFVILAQGQYNTSQETLKYCGAETGKETAIFPPARESASLGAIGKF